MKNKKLVTILAFVLVAVVFAGIGAYAATTLGTQNDPLVTLSYLNERLYPELVSKISDEADKAAAEVAQALENGAGGGAESYTVVTLSQGQRLVGGVGCEILLRIGSATVSASDSPGLVDVTSASSLNDGSSLTANHLYMVTIEGNGIKAAAATVKVLVRGSYTIQ